MILSITSCKTQQPFQLSFGSGGGFTGGYATYTVTQDGKVIKEKAVANGTQQIAMLTKKQIKEIETLIAKVDFPKVFVNNPGNMTNFIYLTRDGKEYKTQWSGKTSGNTALDDLSVKLNALIINK